MELKKYQVDEMVEFGENHPVKKFLAFTDHFRSALVCIREGQSMGPHKTPGDAVLSILSGKAVFTIEGEEHQAGPGAIFTIPSGTMHGVRAVENTIAQVAVFLPNGHPHDH